MLAYIPAPWILWVWVPPIFNGSTRQMPAERQHLPAVCQVLGIFLGMTAAKSGPKTGASSKSGQVGTLKWLSLRCHQTRLAGKTIEILEVNCVCVFLMRKSMKIYTLYFSDLRIIVVCPDGLDCRTTTLSKKVLPKVNLPTSRAAVLLNGVVT